MIVTGEGWTILSRILTHTQPVHLYAGRSFLLEISTVVTIIELLSVSYGVETEQMLNVFTNYCSDAYIKISICISYE